MTRGTLIPIASLVMATAATGLNATDRALAAEPHIARMQVTSGDATARFMALGVSKSVVIDFPTDIKDVAIADKGIAVVVVQSKRRVYIIGAALGQTNVYFFDADGRQIGALDIAVTSTSPPASLENYQYPSSAVVVFNGSKGQTLSCTTILCLDTSKPGSEEAPGTQNINVTGAVAAVSVPAK
jgi:Flp pilus assembly secretin CpaC